MFAFVDVKPGPVAPKSGDEAGVCRRGELRQKQGNPARASAVG